MTTVWTQPWNENDKGLVERTDFCHTDLGYPVTGSSQALTSHNVTSLSSDNATAVPEDIISAMDVSVADKAVMICDALWVNGRVTLDVGPDNTLTAQPYQLGCLCIDD